MGVKLDRNQATNGGRNKVEKRVFGGEMRKKLGRKNRLR